MDAEKIISTLHVFERKVLPVLKDTTSFEKIAEKTGLQKVEVMRALQWLQNKKLIRINKQLKESIILDENGLKYREKGLPEKTFLEEAAKGSCSLDEIRKKSNLSRQELEISLGILKSKAAIEIKKEKEIIVSITDNGRKLLEKGFPEEVFLKKNFPVSVSELKDLDRMAFGNLKKRNRIVKVSIVKIINAELTETGKKIISRKIDSTGIIDRITPSIIKSGTWKNKKLRSYDVKINVPNISGGRIHFVNQAIQYIKRIWLDMGFREVTGPLVQTSFWDLDALFVPQDHPARDMQDTFYIQNPKYGKIPKELAKTVKATHENGWTTGSKGWQYKWSAEEAKKLLMITHDTYLSARTLASAKKQNLPIKTFQIMKTFRNEALSWKSLFEFYQIGGIVADPDANFTHLKGYLTEFFKKMGFRAVRIRPGHFPYVEPAAEVDVFHPVKKEWIELGGSGIFRPEVTKPLLGFECPVLAWGIGLERTIMDYYNFTDIRDVYKNDLKQLKEAKLWMK
jgi:phenylalanyl-tRNA synthetase alpha chain